jgi:hypothetical protein
VSHWTKSYSARLRDAEWRLKHGQSVLSPGQPLRPVTAPPIERAPAGCCQYLVREDGKQKECGCPAAYKGRTRPFLLYCKMHGEHNARRFEVVALDGTGRSLKPLHLENRRNSSSL